MSVKTQIERIKKEVSTQRDLIGEIKEYLVAKGVEFGNIPFVLGRSTFRKSVFGTPIEINTQILQEILDKIITVSIFGQVSNKQIILSGDLADGLYTVLYQSKDGLVSVGQIAQGVTYTNQIPISTDDAGNVFNNGLGYVNDYRVGSYSGTSALSGLSSAPGFFTTGFIPYTNAQAQERIPFYIKGIELDSADDNRFTMVHPNAPSQWYSSVTLSDAYDSIQITQLADKYYMLKPNPNVYSNKGWNNVTVNGIKGTTHIRFSFKGSGAGVILTLNEPIE